MEAGSEIHRRTFSRFINRDHQVVEEVVGSLSKGPRLAAQAFFESLGLAQQVRPTAQPLLEPTIDLIAYIPRAWSDHC